MNKTTLPAITTERVGELDGLRGWAALTVLLGHTFYGGISGTVTWLHTPLVATLTNGNFAVYIFFVLSGYALSSSYWRKRSVEPVLRSAVKRYPRLAIPIFFSCALTWIILANGWSFSHAAGELLRSSLLTPLYGGDASFVELLRFSLIDVFITPVGSKFIPFLWTMKTELAGSVILFVYLLLHHRFQLGTRALVLTMLCGIASGLLVTCFFAGALIGKLRNDGKLASWSQHKYSQIISGALILSSWLVAGLLGYGATPNRSLSLFLSAIFVAAIVINRRAVAFLNLGISQKLGVLSFPMYLVHYSIIISLMSWLAVQAYSHHFSSHLVLIAIATAGCIGSLVLAQLFLPIERLTNFVCDLAWEKTRILWNSSFATPANFS